MKWLLVLVVALVSLGAIICEKRAPYAPKFLSGIKEPEQRAHFIRLMMEQAWTVYKLYNAFGQDTVRIKEQAGINQSDPPLSGESIFAAITTLYLMNYTKEYEASREWIKTELDIQKAILSDKFRTKEIYMNIASLLSTYALTNDQFFLDKAKEFADIDAEHNVEASGELEQQLIEFQFLSDVTGNSSYVKKILKQQEEIWAINDKRKEQYLLNGYPYEVEVKRAIQSNLTYHSTQLDYFRTLLDTKEYSSKIFFSPKSATNSSVTLTHYRNVPFYDSMLYKDCVYGAVLALGSSIWPVNQTVDSRIASELTETCFRVANGTKSQLPPYKFDITDEGEIKLRYERFELAPELAESYYTLYAQTKDEKYRDWAWELAISIYRYARFNEGAFGNVKNVNKKPTIREAYQPPRFLSGTLKYLYLIFNDVEGEEAPLRYEDWVFNLNGHPFPICGKLPVYPCPQS